VRENAGVDRSRALAEFLRSRRERLAPGDVGLPDSPRRRTPGLRREDVAWLADMSVEYYTRLEQGRKLHPSAQVVDALSRALRLGVDERRYLTTLATPDGADPMATDAGDLTDPGHVRHGVRQLIEHLDHLPCVVLTRYFDIVAWNRLYAALVVDLGALPSCERNLLRLMVLDPAVRERYVNLEEMVRYSVAQLRATAVLDPDSPRLSALVAGLSARSEVFREAWASHDVAAKRYGHKVIRHPEVGTVHLDYEVMPADDQVLVIHTPEPGSPSAAALEFLGVVAGEADLAGERFSRDH
jgi:transcriptional regulator with XRE-family HTH domain